MGQSGFVDASRLIECWQCLISDQDPRICEINRWISKIVMVNQKIVSDEIKPEKPPAGLLDWTYTEPEPIWLVWLTKYLACIDKGRHKSKRNEIMMGTECLHDYEEIPPNRNKKRFHRDINTKYYLSLRALSWHKRLLSRFQDLF